MVKFVNVLKNGRVISAIVSAVGAIISAFFAGCRLYVGEMNVKDFEATIKFTNNTNEVTNVQN